MHARVARHKSAAGNLWFERQLHTAVIASVCCCIRNIIFTAPINRCRVRVCKQQLPSTRAFTEGSITCNNSMRWMCTYIMDESRVTSLVYSVFIVLGITSFLTFNFDPHMLWKKGIRTVTNLEKYGWVYPRERLCTYVVPRRKHLLFRVFGFF